jgi:choline dehydrogenase
MVSMSGHREKVKPAFGRNRMARDWDYIIIGGGSAGCTMAARLSEDPTRRTLLIEAGGSDRSPLIAIPGFLENALSAPQFNWSYEGDPDPSLGGRQLTWAAGRVIGGSSSINGMVYGRGLPADYARWVAAGNPGWGWEDMLPYFKRIERWTGMSDPSRGRSGPLWVRRFEDTNPACAAALEALVVLGVPAVEDYSVGVSEGVGLTQATQKRGWRHSAANAYLGPARRRANLAVLTRARALALLFDGSRCVGVRVAHAGSTVDFRAERETIVSSGAIGSPKLLMVSGIGPAEHLHGLGVEVVHDLTGVGLNLNDHVNIKLSAFVNRPTYNTMRGGLSAMIEGARFLATGGGAASSPANHGQAFVRTDPGSSSADVQLQVMPFGFGSEAQMRRDGVTVVVSPCHPEARGRVRLRSADPATAPRITMSMLDSEVDVQRLLRGSRLAYAALSEGPGRTLGGSIYAPGHSDPTDEQWRAFFRETAALNWHPTSTCRMGTGSEAVVDSTLRVHGLSGVSVVDASVMPSVTSANTNIPVIAIAERAADMIVERTR